MVYNWLVFLLCFILAVSWYAGFTPPLLALLYLLVSLFTWLLYALDKRASRRPGRQRIPERRLHYAELFCGWPGAVLARQQLRHKTQKKSYINRFRLMILCNGLLLLSIHIPMINAVLHRGVSDLAGFIHNDALQFLLSFHNSGYGILF